MLRRRDTVAIGNYGRYLQNQCEELSNAYTKLITNINNIRNNYQGVDAEEQIKVFTEKANKINGIMKNFIYYSEYMQKLASYDTDSLNKVKKEINSIISEYKPEMLVSENLSFAEFDVDTNIKGDKENE